MEEGEILAGRYVLGALLGSGGMGRVHAAQDKKLAREVAVKILAAASPEPEVLRRFEREAMAAGSLQHPNVVAVFDVGDENGRPFLVTELLKGSTLRATLAQGALPEIEALRIARQIAAGLAAAHEKGITHRDLKPENVFVTGDGWVKILDFGLVKLTEGLEQRPADESSTGTGRVVGTVGYMAPEQVRGRPVDPRADIFNLGLVLYEMLCGRRAFKAGSPTETGYATLFREPQALPRALSPITRALVARCLKKDAAERIGSAREVLAAIDEAVGAAQERRPPALPGRALAATGLVLALAGAVVVAYGLRRVRSAPVAGAQAPAGTVAILPFGARDAPDFGWLSEGVVDLLARDLEGSDLRAVDSASVLRAVGADNPADIDKVRGASAQLGAKYFVLGRIEERRGQLVLEAVLHTGDAGVPVTEALAQGAPGDLLPIVRRLSDQLQLKSPSPKEFDAKLANLARRTSRSPKALQAWLEGEQLIRRGRWDEVSAAFQRAVAADSSFALAQYRLGFVAAITEPGLAEDALQRALLHVDRLSPPEQMLLPGHLALQQGRLDDAESAFSLATRKYPDDVQAWMELAELYFHSNPLRSRSPQEAANALQHVLVLDPLNTEALAHLSDLAVLRDERTLAGRFADRLLALVDDPGLLATTHLTLAWARNDPKDRQEVLTSLLKPGIPRAILSNFAFIRMEWLQDFVGAAQVALVLESSETSEERVVGLELRGLLELSQGRPEAARAAMRQAISLDRSGDADYRTVWIETLPFFAATPPQTAAARASVDHIDVSRSAYLLPRKRWLSGILAVRAGDFPAAEHVASELDRMPAIEGSSITGDLALSIRARLLAERHDTARALEALEQQKLKIPARYAPYYGNLSEHQLRAELLAANGRNKEALEAYDALDIFRAVDPVLLPLAHLGKARVLDKAGDRDGAVQEYASFVELWKSAEPAERARVDEARVRLEQLRAADQRAAR